MRRLVTFMVLCSVALSFNAYGANEVVVPLSDKDELIAKDWLYTAAVLKKANEKVQAVSYCNKIIINYPHTKYAKLAEDMKKDLTKKRRILFLDRILGRFF